MSQPDFNPFDPISAAMGALHQGNLLAAKDARIAELERHLQIRYDAGMRLMSSKSERIKQLEERLEGMREAGDAIWYCVRHAKRVDPAELQDAIEEWKEARNHA